MEPGRQHAASDGAATLAATAAGTMRAIVQDGYMNALTDGYGEVPA